MNVPLVNATTTTVNEGNKFGFTITAEEGPSCKLYCLNAKDRDEWVHEVHYATSNLSVETMVILINSINYT